MDRTIQVSAESWSKGICAVLRAWETSKSWENCLGGQIICGARSPALTRGQWWLRTRASPWKFSEALEWHASSCQRARSDQPLVWESRRCSKLISLIMRTLEKQKYITGGKGNKVLGATPPTPDNTEVVCNLLECTCHLGSGTLILSCYHHPEWVFNIERKCNHKSRELC